MLSPGGASSPEQQLSSPSLDSDPRVNGSASDPDAARTSLPSTSAPSILSADLTITGAIETAGDIQVEGIVEGDIRASRLTVGETATIKGEVIADDVLVNGRVVGCLRAMKVRLAGHCRVEGDIIHKAIAIESGAHFEGSVQRHDDPIGNQQSRARPSKDSS